MAVRLPTCQVVVHCWGGGGRTGKQLAAWLVAHHRISNLGQVAAEVEGHARAQGASRRVDAAAVKQYLGLP